MTTSLVRTAFRISRCQSWPGSKSASSSQGSTSSDRNRLYNSRTTLLSVDEWQRNARRRRLGEPSPRRRTLGMMTIRPGFRRSAEQNRGLVDGCRQRVRDVSWLGCPAWMSASTLFACDCPGSNWGGSIGTHLRPQKFETCPDWGATDLRIDSIDRLPN